MNKLSQYINLTHVFAKHPQSAPFLTLPTNINSTHYVIRTPNLYFGNTSLYPEDIPDKIYCRTAFFIRTPDYLKGQEPADNNEVHVASILDHLTKVDSERGIGAFLGPIVQKFVMDGVDGTGSSQAVYCTAPYVLSIGGDKPEGYFDYNSFTDGIRSY